MYYEVYIDVLFLVNFMMDYLLLLLLRKMLKCSATHKNICIGSLVGSLSVCLVTALPIKPPWIQWLLSHVVINTLMVKTGLAVREIRKLPGALAGLYAGGFLLGGIFTYLRQYVRVGSLFFALAVLSYWLAQGVWSFITGLQRIGQCRCTVTLYQEGKACTVEALIDTGNQLRDPLTDCPVCVIGQKGMRDLIGEEKIGELRTIGFRSVGEENGEIPVIRLEKMCIHREEERWVEHPVVGICGERVFGEDGCQMIINPDIF